MICWLCGHPIDPALPRRHKLSLTVDEVIPRSLGGSSTELENLRPAHMVCNSQRGNRAPLRNLGRTSRAW